MGGGGEWWGLVGERGREREKWWVEEGGGELVSNWIWTSCRLHRVASGQPILSLASARFRTLLWHKSFLESVHETNPHTNVKQKYATCIHEFSKSWPLQYEGRKERYHSVIADWRAWRPCCAVYMFSCFCCRCRHRGGPESVAAVRAGHRPRHGVPAQHGAHDSQLPAHKQAHHGNVPWLMPSWFLFFHLSDVWVQFSGKTERFLFFCFLGNVCVCEGGAFIVPWIKGGSFKSCAEDSWWEGGLPLAMLVDRLLFIGPEQGYNFWVSSGGMVNFGGHLWVGGFVFSHMWCLILGESKAMGIVLLKKKKKNVILLSLCVSHFLVFMWVVLLLFCIGCWRWCWMGWWQVGGAGGV